MRLHLPDDLVPKLDSAAFALSISLDVFRGVPNPAHFKEKISNGQGLPYHKT